jgi:hypothetical protein
VALYPLGISRRRDAPNVPTQAAGAIDMRWSVAEDLACAYIDAPHHAVPPRLHAAALEAIHRRICVLPVRFGVALRDEAEIHSLLIDRRDELIEHLDRLDRTCEMGLQIAPQILPKTEPDVSSQNAERSRSIIDHLVERLGGSYRQWRRLPSVPSGPIRLAFLVARDRVAVFRSRVEMACCADQGFRYMILGPRPPYSFV